MDAVYILGSGSLVDDLELKYSLRALSVYMLDLDDVFVVGERPKWIKNITHIPAPDDEPKPWRNAHKKILRACEHEKVSSDFLLMYDDIFITDYFIGKDYPYYCRKNADGGSSGRLSFSLHYPMIITKEFYKKMPLDLNVRANYSCRSFYANFFRFPAVVADDCIIRYGEKISNYAEQIKGRSSFTTDDAIMLKPDFIEFLETLYPTPSQFE